MGTGEFIDLGFPDQADPATKLAAALAKLQAGTGYEPGPVDPLRLTLEGAADMAADNESQAVTVARAVTRFIGERLVGVPFDEAVPATASVVVAASTGTGGDITAGVTEISIDGQSFLAGASLTIAAAGSATVTFTASDPGAQNNGLFETPEKVTALAWVDTLTLSTPTANGTDAETDDHYEAKIARKLRSIGRPILKADFEERGVDWPGVARALAIDGYDAVALTSGNDATETLAVHDADGEPLSDPEMAALAASIAVERETGWNSYVIAPTYTTVNVAGQVILWPDADPTATIATLNQTVADYLHPARFGSSDREEAVDWNAETKVWRTELIALVNSVAGVRRLVNGTLLLNGADNDVTLTGVAPLTRAGTIAFTT